MGPSTARVVCYSFVVIGTLIAVLFTTDSLVMMFAPTVASVNEASVPLVRRNALIAICFDTPGKTTMTSGCRITLASFRRSNSVDDIIVIAPSKEHVREISALTDQLRLKFEFVGLGPYDCKIDSGCERLPLFSFGRVHHYDYQESGKFTGNALRHVWYDEVLSRVEGYYDRMLIADGKDVYFQADPFSTALRLGQTCRDKICLFSEPRNSRMTRFFVKKTKDISHCLSSEQRNHIMQERREGYANGGVILGTGVQLRPLCRSVVRKANECDFWQADQHFLNIVISTSNIPFHIFEDGTVGLMAKIYASQWQSWAESSSGWTQRAGPLAGRAPLSFIHQYQWDEGLKKLIEARINAWLRQNMDRNRCCTRIELSVEKL